MARIVAEDSLKNIKDADRFKLVHEAVKLARSAPVDTEHKPAVWALKMIAEGKYSVNEEIEQGESLKED